jgi:hypothetical protein
MVGCAHDGFIVLDYDDSVAQTRESAEDGNEAIHVSRVQADGWFVEDEECIDE